MNKQTRSNRSDQSYLRKVSAAQVKQHLLVQVKLILLLLLTVSPYLTKAQGPSSIAGYDITWKELGTDENSSMPLGNGDIALNAWTEQNGDIVLLLAKGDACWKVSPIGWMGLNDWKRETQILPVSTDLD
jgi:hypothetical protein